MPVRLAREGPTALVVLDRPERGNALSAHDLSHELPEVWRTVRDDAAIRAVVVTGAGAQSFTSGIDVTDPAVHAWMAAEETPDALRFTGRQHEVWKPILTAVNGRCLGGGLWFLADCDFALAAEHATFGNPGVSVGVVTASTSVALARRGAFAEVMRMAIFGRHAMLDAETALRAGFVQRLTPGDELLEAALADAAKIARNSPAAVERMLRTMWSTQSMALGDALAVCDEVQLDWRSHPDSLEGPRAFGERREPRWAAVSGAEA